jgi:hypothetical protein
MDGSRKSFGERDGAMTQAAPTSKRTTTEKGVGMYIGGGVLALILIIVLLIWLL